MAIEIQSKKENKRLENGNILNICQAQVQQVSASAC